LRRARERDHRPELGRRRAAAGLREGLEDRADVLDAGERETAVRDRELPELRRLRERLANGFLVEGGLEGFEERASGRRARQGGDETENDVELERLELDAGLRRSD
jgi:hypothetical protein